MGLNSISTYANMRIQSGPQLKARVLLRQSMLKHDEYILEDNITRSTTIFANFVIYILQLFISPRLACLLTNTLLVCVFVRVYEFDANGSY